LGTNNNSGEALWSICKKYLERKMMPTVRCWTDEENVLLARMVEEGFIKWSNGAPISDSSVHQTPIEAAIVNETRHEASLIMVLAILPFSPTKIRDALAVTALGATVYFCVLYLINDWFRALVSRAYSSTC